MSKKDKRPIEEQEKEYYEQQESLYQQRMNLPVTRSELIEAIKNVAGRYSTAEMVYHALNALADELE